MVDRIYDSIRFLSKLNIYKLWNAILIYGSYLLSKYTQKAIQWGLPFNISIEPTTSCNLGCPECPSGLKQFTRPVGNLEFNSYTKTIDNLQKHLIYLYFYFQGEPYLHPKILDMIKYASSKKIYTVISTNGHYLTPRRAEETVSSGLDRILISVDGATQDTYQQYRIGGTLDKVLEGAKNLVEAKKKLNSNTPYIIFQMLVVKPNENEIEQIQYLGKEIGVNEVKLKSAQIYNYESGSDLIPSIEKYARYYQDINDKWHIKNELLNHCWKLWHSCVITWDGAVVPCSFDKDATYHMGNAFSEPFKSIWKNEKYKIFRSKILKGRSEIDICKNCSEGTQVWV
jgi:radical SAM protein with 4Fe4S-binding SPASM domain